MIFQESEKVELKQEFTNDLKKEIVAFANTLGGTIYIGISDDGEVVGIPSVNEVSLQITNSIRNSIKPDVSIFISHKIKNIDGKNIIEINISRGTNTPYYIADKGLKPSGVYIRQGTASVPSSDEMIKKMIKETDGDSYEELRSLNQDLTFNYVEKELKKDKIKFGISEKKTLGLISSDGLYTNLALLLSDECKHSLKVAVFEGEEEKVFKDRKEFLGSLLSQLRGAYEYIDLNNKTKSNFDGLNRIDEKDYPIEAIREALLNAIVHRDYSFSASTLINIYEKRIEFISLGGLVSGLSLEAVLLGVSQSRNMKLSNFFYRLHLIEAYGTGIRKIISSYKKFDKKVEIIAAEGIFKVVLPNLHYKTATTVENNYQEINAREDMIYQKEYQNIIAYIKRKDKISRKEVENLLGVSQTKAITILNEMLDLKLINKIGDGKNRRYII